MPRPVSISDDQILDAARALFIARGFEASTAVIARQAGVSEGSIFKRFPTKEALFEAALGLPEDPPWIAAWPACVGTRDPRSHLVSMVRQVLEVFREVVPRFVALQARGVGRALQAEHVRERPMLRYRRALARYLDAEIAQGRARPTDTAACADALLGASFLWTLQAVARRQATGADELERYAESLVGLVWGGLAPAGGGDRPREGDQVR